MRSTCAWLLYFGVVAMGACGGGSSGDAASDANNTTGDAASDSAIPTDIATSDAPPSDALSADASDAALPPRTTQTNGSTVAIASDDSVAAVANRTADSVTVFTLQLQGASPVVTPNPNPLAPISTGAGSRPWGVVIGNDNNTAYVVLRGARQVVKITNLRGTPTLSTQVAATGSEPTGIAITPSGTKLYVPNWSDGTVTVINTADMSVASTVDLNGPLAATGLLGSNVPTAGRAALAHPRAIAITNGGSGSDANETAYVTEFFSQALPNAAATMGAHIQDVNRQGLVYVINVGTSAVSTATIGPVQNTTFQDSNGGATGCFPNQLYGVAINNGRLYVSSVCESPAGPIGPVQTSAGPPPTFNVANFKTEIFSLLSVINTTTNSESPGEQLLMTARWNAAFTQGADGGVSSPPRFPLIVNDLAFVPNTNVMYASAYGSDAVYRIPFQADGSATTVGSQFNLYIDLASPPPSADGGAPAAGNLPVGIAISNSGGVALVNNENSRNLSIVEFATQAVAGSVPTEQTPTGAAATVNTGRRFFVTGLGRWSLNGAAWNSCESCHGDGLTDDVTWFFGRGPRQTISLDGTYAPDGTTQRLLNWTAINDEVHDFETNTRANSGGVGAVVWQNNTPPTAPAASDRIIFEGAASVTSAQQVVTAAQQNGLNGSVATMMPTAPSGAGPAFAATSPVQPPGATQVVSALSSWNAIDAYVKTIAAPHAPTNLAAGDVTAGAGIFAQNNCAACHGGADWTISRRFYTPGQSLNQACAVPPAAQPANTLCAGTYALAGFPATLNPAASMGALRYLPTSIADAAANDQINCVLRAVGTFPASGTTGIAPANGSSVLEVRGTNMTTTAQGASGFNPPSLVGVATGAPYFHAGNARSLEEVFDPTFSAHYGALSQNFLSSNAADNATQIRQLVAFLSSIDDSTSAVSLPTIPGIASVDLCPATFP